MKELIGWILVGLATLGTIYTIGLIISYILLPKDLNDIDYQCNCKDCTK